jgi:hypothetical protein
MSTYDCPPSLDDTQVLEFCKLGFLMLDGVVPAAINQQALEYLEAHPQGEPTAILHEDWFHQNVIINPAVAGAVRSLLGPHFGLPNIMSNHRVQCPLPAQQWHRDGGSRPGPALNHLQVFYYPQACAVENGPTELLPGSHHLFNQARAMAHLGHVRGTYRAAGSAGSVFLTVYSIWHRRSGSTAPGLRNLLKYNYWRTAAPARDWVAAPGFDPKTANYVLNGPVLREQFQDCNDAAQMFFWLSGRAAEFNLMGGQGWPLPANHFNGPYGYPGDPTNRRD